MKWISIKEQLPICEHIVFGEDSMITKTDDMKTYFESEIVMIVVNQFDDDKLKNRYFALGCLDSNNEWLISEGDFMSYLEANENVSHWCRTPKLPKI